MARHWWIFTLAGVLLLGGFLAAPIPAPADGDAADAGEGATPPTVVKQVAPVYPEEARAAGAEGMVVVKLLVGPDGSPKKAGIRESSGRDDLDAAAVDAIRQWEFRPAMKDGKPVDMEIAVPIKFELDGDGEAKVKAKKKANAETKVKGKKKMKGATKK